MWVLIILIIGGFLIYKLGGLLVSLSESYNEKKIKEDYFKKTLSDNVENIAHALTPTPPQKDVSKEFQKSVQDLKDKQKLRKAMKEELGVE